jgi:hypothetical protein
MATTCPTKDTLKPISEQEKNETACTTPGEEQFHLLPTVHTHEFALPPQTEPLRFTEHYRITCQALKILNQAQIHLAHIDVCHGNGQTASTEVSESRAELTVL